MKYRIKSEWAKGRLLTRTADGRYTGYWTMDEAQKDQPWYWPAVGGREKVDETYPVYWSATDLEPYFEVGDRVISAGHEGDYQADLCAGSGKVAAARDGKIMQLELDDGRFCSEPKNPVPDPTPAAVIKIRSCPSSAKKPRQEPKLPDPAQHLLDEAGKRFAVGSQIMLKTLRWGDQLATLRPTKRLDEKVRWCVFMGEWIHYTDRDVINAEWPWTIVFQP